ncbi:MAG: glutamate--tRNA ligase family protein, partial [Patescibacteria group bacterium]
SKLSKRQGDVSVEEYIKKGYLKEAILNFAAFLGWNPGSGEENEIFSISELEQAFTLEKVHKAGAIFNIEKLDWFNWRWQKRTYNQELEAMAKEIDAQVGISQPRKDQFDYKFNSAESENLFFEKRAKKLLTMCEKHIPEEFKTDEKKLLKALITVEEKVLRSPKEVSENIRFYYDLPEYDTSLILNEKMVVDPTIAKQSLIAAKEALSKENFTDDLSKIQTTLLEVAQKLGFKNGQVFWPLRSACTGLQFSPGVFEAIWVLGQTETLRRIDVALAKL